MGVSQPTPASGTPLGGVVYECVRCGTQVSAEQLAQLPEIKCICGYRVLRKARPNIVKQVKAI
jgi:DNA-directed RNA polymerase subunit P